MGCGAVLTTAAVLVAGCGQEAAEPLAEEEATAAGGSESVEEVVEEIRALAAELEALDDQRATVGFLGLADPYARPPSPTVTTGASSPRRCSPRNSSVGGARCHRCRVGNRGIPGARSAPSAPGLHHGRP